MSENKFFYLTKNRTYCDGCGNSDADMDLEDELCYDCLHPEEAKANAKAGWRPTQRRSARSPIGRNCGNRPNCTHWHWKLAVALVKGGR